MNVNELQVFGKDDEKGVQNVDTPGGSQKVCIINESGLYHAVNE